MIEVKLEVSHALAHPLRVSVLEALKTETASAQSLAEKLPVGPGNVTYHLTVLRGAGLIEEVEADVDVARRPGEQLFRFSTADPHGPDS